jgi:oligopeptide transport system ATP-binding protein
VAENNALVRVQGLKKHFPILRGMLIKRPAGYVKAIDGISFEVMRGETLGLVGESGSGKSTTGRTLLALYKPTEGQITFDGVDLTTLSPKELRRLRPRMQMIFQDPYASLNPRLTVEELLFEPMLIHTDMTLAQRRDRVQELLQLVGLNPRFDRRYPHEFSGGQRQRIGVARALTLNPDFIICDEPISALDVSVQAQVVNLLEDLQEEFKLTYLFIAHDLSIIRHISTRVAVMYLGKLMELAPRDELYNSPLHPYTQALLSAVPIPDPEVATASNRIILKGDIPSPASPPAGCVFNTRCWLAHERCFKEVPEWRQVRPGHLAACHLIHGEAKQGEPPTA